MYISTIILTIIVCILAFYLHNKDEKHRHELNELKEKFQQENKTALFEQNADLDKYYQSEINELKAEISKIKDGTLLEDLKKENENLKEALSNMKYEHEEERKRTEKIYNEEIESIFERCYDGLIAVENTLKKLNEPYNLEKIISCHKSFTSMGQVLIVESNFLTERIESLIEWEKD